MIKPIYFEWDIRSTEINRQTKIPVVYTNDLNTVKFHFVVLGLTQQELESATARTLINMRDGSLFGSEADDVSRFGNTFMYTLKENEGKHAGISEIQLVIEIGGNESSSQLYKFEIFSGLDGKVPQEVLIAEWTLLTDEARAYIDQFIVDEAERQTLFETNKLIRENTFNQSEETRSTIFNQSEAARTEMFNDSESANQTTFNENEDARQLAFDENEGIRQSDFDTSQSERAGVFSDAQADRQVVFEASESARTNTFGVSEGVRSANEDIRIAKESERVSSENKRVSDENNRVGNEAARLAQESNRATSEVARVDAESNRVTAEGVRATSENARENAEDLRVVAEDERKVRFEELVVGSVDDHYIFGVHWDKSANPTLSRTDDATGLVANAGKDGEFVINDFDKMPIYRKIGEATDTYGNTFIRIPKFYIQKSDGPDFFKLRISKTQYPGFYLPAVFYDFENEKELDYYFHGKYKANLSGDGTRLESKSGAYPLASRNIVQFRDLARANNTMDEKGYQQLDIHAQDVLSVLFTVEFATLHSQSVMQGFTTGRYTSSELAIISETETNRIVVSNSVASNYRTGQTISIGTSQGGNQVFYGRTITTIDTYDADNQAINFDGGPVNVSVGNVLYNTGWKNGFSNSISASSGYIVANDGKYPCSYRGIESPWGDLWQFVDGLNINDNQSWVTPDAKNYASNVFTEPYKKIGYVNSNENGYPKQMGYDPQFPFVNMATVMGGGSSTYYADYHYQVSGQRVARVGGNWNVGSYAGFWFWYLNDSSGRAAVGFGGRLLKKAL